MNRDVEVSIFEIDAHCPVASVQSVGHYSGGGHLELIFADKAIQSF